MTRRKEKLTAKEAKEQLLKEGVIIKCEECGLTYSKSFDEKDCPHNSKE